MRKVFEVELSSKNGCTNLALPATPYALLDALEKLELSDGETPRWELLSAFDVGYIFQPMNQDDGSLRELNAVAHKFAQLNETEITIFEGLTAMERMPMGQPIPLPRLIDLVYSTDRCHLVEGVVTDEQLGRFCAENGFAPEVDGLSDEAFELLDHAKIGQKFRQAEGGVFTSGGYVQKHDELRQVYKTLDLTPKKLDYTILAETAGGCEVKFPFPANEPMGTEPVRCVDCAASALTGISGGMERMDLLARRLSGMAEAGTLAKFKAIIEATGCDEIGWALSLADELEQYRFDPEQREYEDVAKSSLSMGLTDQQMELLLPYVQLYAFGRELVQAHGGALTGYGLVERHDREPIQSMKQEPSQGGMEMM